MSSTVLDLELEQTTRSQRLVRPIDSYVSHLTLGLTVRPRNILRFTKPPQVAMYKGELETKLRSSMAKQGKILLSRQLFASCLGRDPTKP